MKKTIIFIALILTFFSCKKNRLNHYQNNITEFLIKNHERPNAKLLLDTVSMFNWDEIIIAGPYTDLKKISNYNFNNFPNTIKSFDNFVLFGFINKKKGVKYFEIDRYLIPDNLFSKKNMDYKIYKKKESVFLISK